MKNKIVAILIIGCAVTVLAQDAGVINRALMADKKREIANKLEVLPVTRVEAADTNVAALVTSLYPNDAAGPHRWHLVDAWKARASSAKTLTELEAVSAKLGSTNAPPVP